MIQVLIIITVILILLNTVKTTTEEIVTYKNMFFIKQTRKTLFEKIFKCPEKAVYYTEIPEYDKTKHKINDIVVLKGIPCKILSTSGILMWEVLNFKEEKI